MSWAVLRSLSIFPTKYPRCLSVPIVQRTLFTADQLGLTKFNEERARVSKQLGSRKDSFINHMANTFRGKSETSKMVYTEDLKNMINVSTTDDDIELCICMLQRFNQQNKELRFGSFTFGPVLMRLLHVLEKPDVVMKALQDPSLDKVFDQFQSYQLGMDLLYKKERYQDVLTIFNHLREKQLTGSRFPKNGLVLVLGACYQLGTPEAYTYAINLVREARQAGALILRKGLTFTAAFALKQNDAKVAMELLALTAQMNYITVRNLRLIALSQLDRHEDIFLVLRQIIHEYHHMRQDQAGICPDTVERIRLDLEKKGDPERLQVFSQLQRALKEGKHMSENTLDELLNRSMEHISRDTNPPAAMFNDKQRSFENKPKF